MKNAIKYYYQIEVDDIEYKDNKYYFDKYLLIEHTKDIDINLYEYLVERNVLSYEIIWNKDENYITSIEKKSYILLKRNRNISISFSMLEQFMIPTDKKDIVPWHRLWMNKVDYYEKHMKTLTSKKLKEGFSYYIGLTENAIAFYQMIKKESNLFISHARLSNDEDFLNPLNFAIDYRVRDVAEYSKYLFFENKLNLNDLYLFFQKNYFNEHELLLFYARMLYPSYYFDCYDRISKGIEDCNLNNIRIKVNEYECFLRELYLYIKKYTNIPKIDWLIERKEI
jgi:hypothetical protein